MKKFVKAKKGARSFRYIMLIGVGVLLTILIGWILFVVFKTPKYQVPDTSEWKTGDIFFSVGDSWKSVVVRAATGARHLEMPDSTPSHCGIILCQEDGIWLVHESTDKKRLVKERVEDYQKINGSYCLYAKSGPCNVDTLKLKDDIRYWLETKKPFDNGFNHTDTTSLYCTEFVVLLMEKNGCRVFSSLRANQYIYPKDLESICLECKNKQAKTP